MMPSSFCLVTGLEVGRESLLDRVGDLLHVGGVIIFCTQIACQSSCHGAAWVETAANSNKVMAAALEPRMVTHKSLVRGWIVAKKGKDGEV
jgi:hypothetical protein